VRDLFLLVGAMFVWGLLLGLAFAPWSWEMRDANILLEQHRTSLSRVRTLAIGAAVFITLAMASGCYTENSNSNYLGAPSVVVGATPAPSPSPSASPAATGGPVAVVEVHYFGKSKGTPGKDISVGEVGDVTASPYDAQGVDVGRPTDPVVWSCSAGVVLVQSQSNHYNAQITGKTAGPYTCTATAGGVMGTLAGTVVP
jgi:hypothetical protein